MTLRVNLCHMSYFICQLSDGWNAARYHRSAQEVPWNNVWVLQFQAETIMTYHGILATRNAAVSCSVHPSSIRSQDGLGMVKDTPPGNSSFLSLWVHHGGRHPVERNLSLVEDTWHVSTIPVTSETVFITGLHGQSMSKYVICHHGNVGNVACYSKACRIFWGAVDDIFPKEPQWHPNVYHWNKQHANSEQPGAQRSLVNCHIFVYLSTPSVSSWTLAATYTGSSFCQTLAACTTVPFCTSYHLRTYQLWSWIQWH